MFKSILTLKLSPIQCYFLFSGGIPTTFNHGLKNYELLPTAIGTFGTNPVDFRVPYSLSLIVSKPEFIGSKAVLIHISDSSQVN